MKCYTKLRNLKKSTKIGLVTSAIYVATSLALPAFANNALSVNLDGVQTFDQANQLYHQTLVEYAQDKKISTQEVKNLYKIVEKGALLERATKYEAEDVIRGQEYQLWELVKDLYAEKSKLLAPVKALEEKISEETYTLKLIAKQAKNEQIFLNYEQDLKSIQDELDNLLSIYYPGLLKSTESEYNMKYSAEKKIKTNFREMLLPLIEKADKMFQVVHKRDSLWHFLRWNGEYLTIHDVTVFREIINSQPEKISYIPKDYTALKQERLDLIQQLEQKKAQIKMEIPPNLKNVNTKVENLKKQIIDLNNQEIVSPVFFKSKLIKFGNYTGALEKKEQFIEKYLDISKYWARSSMIFNRKLAKNKNKKEYDFKEEVSELEGLLNSEGFQLEVEGIKNPSRVKFPMWATILGGLAVSFLRVLIVPKYVTRREWNGFDIADFVGLNYFGVMFADSLHPLVFPIRVFGVPFIAEPIMRICGGSEPIK